MTGQLLKIKLLALGLFLCGNIIVSAETQQPAEKIDSAVSVLSAEKLESVITALESRQGAYSPGLEPVLNELGFIYQELGDYPKAARTFEKALQVSKVNHGLHEISQLTIVESLIDTYSALNDWQRLGDKLHYLLWLYRRNYSNEDDRLLPVISRVGRWYTQAYQSHNAGEAVSYLVKADDLYDEVLANMDEQAEEQSAQLIEVLGQAAMVNYQIAGDIDDSFKMSHRDIREAMIPNKRPSPYLNEIAVREYYFDQSFHKGKRHLARIISIYESELPTSIKQYAQALIYLGDYYLSLDRKWNAMKNYRKAYTALVENNVEAGLIESLFGQPRRVEPFVIPGNELPENPNRAFADAILDIPVNGWPSNIVITTTHPSGDTKLAGRARYALAATRFRPRFEHGVPVNTTGISLRFYFVK